MDPNWVGITQQWALLFFHRLFGVLLTRTSFSHDPTHTFQVYGCMDGKSWKNNGEQNNKDPKHRGARLLDIWSIKETPMTPNPKGAGED